LRQKRDKWPPRYHAAGRGRRRHQLIRAATQRRQLWRVPRAPKVPDVPTAEAPFRPRRLMTIRGCQRLPCRCCALAANWPRRSYRDVVPAPSQRGRCTGPRLPHRACVGLAPAPNGRAHPQPRRRRNQMHMLQGSAHFPVHKEVRHGPGRRSLALSALCKPPMSAVYCTAACLAHTASMRTWDVFRAAECRALRANAKNGILGCCPASFLRPAGA